MSGQFAIYPSLRDRVVFITGGASGIGAEHVAQFTAQGAKVAFVDIADDAARELVGRLKTAGQAAPFYQHCDLKISTHCARQSPRWRVAWGRSPCW